MAAAPGHVFPHQAQRPRSAPFGRAPGQRAPLWRQPRRKEKRKEKPKAAKVHSADSETDEAECEASPGGSTPIRSARDWHVPDLKIQQLVESTRQELPRAASTGPAKPKAAVSPCQVNRPMLSCGRLKRQDRELEAPEAASPASPASVPAPGSPGLSAWEAQEAYEAMEMERIKFYFRKPLAEAPCEMARCASKEMARCASVPLKRGKTPAREVEVPVTLNFVETGDKYTIRVDPDLRVGPDRGPDREPGQCLKGIIEEISGIAASCQTLFCNRCKMSNDRHTLRSYNAHQDVEVLVRFKGCRPGILQASTLKWRQQQAVREQRRQRARALSASEPKCRVMECWQSCVVPQNGTYFQYAPLGTTERGHVPKGMIFSCLK
ncbi:unnamed protein product [Effrenium voratum]|nr:unnamed protein product [Effrenium voratum]